MISETTEQPAAEKATPLKLPARLDLDCYSDAVIHDANWRRIAAFPKTELGIAMAQQVTDALNQSAAVDAAERALKRIAHIDLDTAEATHTEAGAALAQLEELKLKGGVNG